MAAPALQPIVIWFGRVGDMILLSALLGVLHRRFGGRCYVIGAGSWPAELYATHADVARIECLRRYTVGPLDANWWRALRQLRARRGAPVYVCEFDVRKLARVRRLLAASGTDPARCLYLTQTASWQQQHWVDRLVSFGRLTPPALDAAAYPWPSGAPRCAPHLEVAPAAAAACDGWLAAQGLAGAPLVLLQPGNRRTMRGRRLRLAADDDRAWPVERWAQLAQRLHAQLPAARIVLCGAPREALLLHWIAQAARLPALLSAELPLPRLLALCARAHSMISVNTGPAHLAAAVSLPVVVLFGAQLQSEWLPRSPSGSAVIGLGGQPETSRIDALSVERVFAAWCALPPRAAAPAARPAAPATAP